MEQKSSKQYGGKYLPRFHYSPVMRFPTILTTGSSHTHIASREARRCVPELILFITIRELYLEERAITIRLINRSYEFFSNSRPGHINFL